MRTPSIRMLSVTRLNEPTRQLCPTIERSTRPPEIIDPLPMMLSSTMPGSRPSAVTPCTVLLGGSGGCQARKCQSGS